MRLVDITKETEGTFFRCLHDEEPDDPRVIGCRRKWFEEFKDKGLRAKVLILDTGEVVGLCQYLPIEHSSSIGQDLFSILCIWVHGYDHHVGNRQGKGYGRFILNAIEEDAKKSGAKGVAAWGMDFPYWNPVSFYEHMGYERADKNGMVVLVWKTFHPNAKPPQLPKQIKELPAGNDKVNVMVFVNAWCLGACYQGVAAKEAIEGLEDKVNFTEIDASCKETMLSYGLDSGLFLDGKAFRPYEPPFTAKELHEEILRLYDEKHKK